MEQHHEKRKDRRNEQLVAARADLDRSGGTSRVCCHRRPLI